MLTVRQENRAMPMALLREQNKSIGVPVPGWDGRHPKKKREGEQYLPRGEIRSLSVQVKREFRGDYACLFTLVALRLVNGPRDK